MKGRDEDVTGAAVIRKRYLFFLRHFNDTDNIAPIIHAYLGASPGHSAEVLLYDENYCGRGDPNLSLLSQEFPGRFSWSWLGDHFGLSFERSRAAERWKRQLRTRLKALVPTSRRKPHVPVREPHSNAAGGHGSTTPRARPRGCWQWLPRGLRSLADVRSGSAGGALIRDTLAPLATSPRPVDLVIFDVVRSHHVRGYLKALRELGCRSIICLPVSPLINYNVLREYDFTAPGSGEFMNRHDYSGFDAISYVDGLYLDTYRRFMGSMGLTDGLPRNSTCIGSLRYYPQWIRIRDAALPSSGPAQAEPSAQGPGSKHLLVLLSRLKTNVNRHELQACLDWLAQAEGFEIRVKGHTRAGKGDDALQLHSLKDANNEDTSTLIDWSDAIVFWGTSAALEGYAKGKTMACIPFVSSNLNLYEHYEAGFIALCRDDMVLFLHQYAQTGVAAPYSHAGIDRLMREVVQAGQRDWLEHREFTVRYLAEQEQQAPTSSISEAR